ncbi:MAG TPA: GTPase ObgE, partial [Bdellovibrionota bacterium]|nr:GTPase ObgE [Bdellovibrionota bacterium]
MRFIDEAQIHVAAGHGGSGCVAFRREKYVPKGGPSGGDGGEGGHVTFIASDELSTLQDLRFKRKYLAKNGEPGKGGFKSGRDGESIEVRVPTGTVIRDLETGEELVDFVDDGQIWVACKGGRGGKGNLHFKSSTHQAPKFAQPGEPGESRDLQVELKLLADAALVGYPNAGKSSLISRISAARPKVADYAFTTLTPNLGVVTLGDEGAGFVV